jgi:hypothetical protein
MFRPGGHNGHTVYWDDDAPGLNRFVGTAMTPMAAVRIADALNRAGVEGDWIDALPPIPKRGTA